MLRRVFFVLLILLVGCTSVHPLSEFSKYRVETIGIYGSIKPNRNYSKGALRLINTSLEEKVARFLEEEKGYRTLVWPPASHPQNETVALATARTQGADTLLVLKSSLAQTNSTEARLETKFRLLSIPDKKILFAGKFEPFIDTSTRIDYASVIEGLKEFPGK